MGSRRMYGEPVGLVEGSACVGVAEGASEGDALGWEAEGLAEGWTEAGADDGAALWSVLIDLASPHADEVLRDGTEAVLAAALGAAHAAAWIGVKAP